TSPEPGLVRTRVACREGAPSASAPNHSVVSLTSRSTEIHSAAVPSGIDSCGSPGAALTHPAGAAWARATTVAQAGEEARGSESRPGEPRRAGRTDVAAE